MELLVETSKILLILMLSAIYYSVKISWMIVKWPLKITLLIIFFLFFYVLIGLPVKILASIYHKAGGQEHLDEDSIFYDMKDYIESSFRFLVGKEKPEIEEETEEDEEIEEDNFSFVQLFSLDKNTSLAVDHVEYCPDETAFVRVISDDAYSKLYKKKVSKDKRNARYIKHNGNKYYLDDKKTAPVVIME